MVEYYEHKQRNVVEETMFQDYHVETISNGFQVFCLYFVCPFVQGACKSAGSSPLLNRVKQLAISVLKFWAPLSVNR